MTTQNNWLDSLQVGDQVAIQGGNISKRKYTLALVAKIPTTPHGRIVLDNGSQFGRDGIEWGLRENGAD